MAAEPERKLDERIYEFSMLGGRGTVDISPTGSRGMPSVCMSTVPA